MLKFVMNAAKIWYQRRSPEKFFEIDIILVDKGHFEYYCPYCEYSRINKKYKDAYSFGFYDGYNKGKQDSI